MDTYQVTYYAEMSFSSELSKEFLETSILPLVFELDNPLSFDSYIKLCLDPYYHFDDANRYRFCLTTYCYASSKEEAKQKAGELLKTVKFNSNYIKEWDLYCYCVKL